MAVAASYLDALPAHNHATKTCKNHTPKIVRTKYADTTIPEPSHIKKQSHGCQVSC